MEGGNGKEPSTPDLLKQLKYLDAPDRKNSNILEVTVSADLFSCTEKHFFFSLREHDSFLLGKYVS